ncbi:hypothetical protein [Vibrio barjaei]|uniref:hypothetical protein n=1 Tax=Vibrio barjaei TaxID=1676683 RepID=UPI0022849D45|nr:hypothetical protein [Vibrio barjaei]MCY9872987.1 hypothetical protein [Vibrio barjaei]
MKLSQIAALFAVSIAVAGCSSTHYEVQTDYVDTDFLNRAVEIPDELVKVPAVSPILVKNPTAKGEEQEGSVESEDVLANAQDMRERMIPGEALEKVAVKQAEEQGKGEEFSYIAEASTYIITDHPTTSGMMWEGETYHEVLSRWMHEQHFKFVGWHLDDEAREAFLLHVEETVEMTGSLESLVSQFMELVNSDHDGQFPLRILLDAEKKEAIITSSNVPMTMFHVESGSLRNNFIRLGEHYGWGAVEKQYLAKDYDLAFAFPIVTEKGNVKAALGKLLSPFPSLRGATVPSSREIYVISEEETK